MTVFSLLSKKRCLYDNFYNRLIYKQLRYVNLNEKNVVQMLLFFHMPISLDIDVIRCCQVFVLIKACLDHNIVETPDNNLRKGVVGKFV